MSQCPDIYMIDDNGSEQKLAVKKLRFAYPNGAKISVEINKWDTSEIVVRGYHGTEEYKETDIGITLNVRPGGCNLIRVTPELNIKRR